MTAQQHPPADDRGPFAQVPFLWVREVGADAAVLMALIAFRADREPWPASYDELAAESGLSRGQVKASLTKLREAGWVSSQRAQAWGSTQAWTATFAQVTPRGTKPPARKVRNRPAGTAHSALPSLETVKTTRPNTADAVPQEAEAVLDYAADEALPMLVAVPDLPSEPVEKREADGPPKTAQTLVARWVDGYRSTNDGADPPGPLMGRVAGQCRNVAKGCSSHDDWVASYGACYAAGRESSVSVTSFMGRRVQRYGKVNHDLAIYQGLAAANAINGPGATALGMLTSASSTNPPGDTR